MIRNIEPNIYDNIVVDNTFPFALRITLFTIDLNEQNIYIIYRERDKYKKGLTFYICYSFEALVV